MSDCVFCKIVAGELPSYKVYEDDLFLGFLDIHPLAIGNTLLIPKTHYRWVTDVPEFGQYFEIAKKIALTTQKATHSDYTTFATFGTEIEHAHIRIIPRCFNDLQGEGLDTSKTLPISEEEMRQIAISIKQNL